MKTLTAALLLAPLLSLPRLQDSPTATPTPAADPADVATPDGLLAAVYDVISGPAGEQRNWERFRSLFAPDARLAVVRSSPGTEAARLMVLRPDEYIERSGAWLEENGFFETEVARTTQRFGHVLHAFSTYEARRNADDPEPFLSGINSIQLVHDGERWWVHSILWEAAHAELAIPAEYRAR